MKIGIYCIRNLVNNKVYIGQSQHIQARFNEHRADLRHSRHHNPCLTNSWNKYGPENFEFTIIEECTLDVIDELEIQWIQFSDSCNLDKGYNLSTGGESSARGVKRTEEQNTSRSEWTRSNTNTPEFRIRHSEALKRAFSTPEHKELMSGKSKRSHNTPGYLENQRVRQNTPEYREMLSIANLLAWKRCKKLKLEEVT